MTIKHTPGPRTVQHRGDLGEYHSLAEGGAVIGRFNKRADAVLDTAAPDLLWSSQRALAILEADLNGTWKKGEVLRSWAAWAEETRAAIAKAEGTL